jgi:hypothetical protein
MIKNDGARWKINSEMQNREVIRLAAARAGGIFFTLQAASIFLPHFPVL